MSARDECNASACSDEADFAGVVRLHVVECCCRRPCIVILLRVVVVVVVVAAAGRRPQRHSLASNTTSNAAVCAPIGCGYWREENAAWNMTRSRT